jgi:RIO kinase 1
VYRPRSLRNLRKDHIYREGRSELDSDGLNIFKERQLKAIRKRTAYGQDLMHKSWIEHEFRTLQILHDAGCDVPKPYERGHNAILMEYIGVDRIGAPTLNGISLGVSQAVILFERLVHNIDLMLSSQRVHGDLSAYNILYWDGTITIIDFPQSIHPERNPNAYVIFQRDVIRVCEYFNRQGLKTDPQKLAKHLWTSHGYNTVLNYLIDEVEDYS